MKLFEKLINKIKEKKLKKAEKKEHTLTMMYSKKL